MATTRTVLCTTEECLNEAKRAGLCWRCIKAKQQGRLVVSARRPESAKDRLEEAALALADANSEDDGAYRAARSRFWSAFQAAVAEVAKTCQENHGSGTGG